MRVYLKKRNLQKFKCRPAGHERKLKPRRGGILVEKEFLRLSKVPLARKYITSLTGLAHKKRHLFYRYLIQYALKLTRMPRGAALLNPVFLKCTALPAHRFSQ